MTSNQSQKSKPNSPQDFFKELLSRETFPSQVLLLATDWIRKERALEKIFQKFQLAEKKPAAKTQVTSALNSHSFLSNYETLQIDASELTAARIISLTDELSSLLLFSSRRFYLINNVQELNAEIAKSMIGMLKKAGTSTDTSIVLCGTTLSATSPLRKFFSEKSFLLDLAELSGADLRRWTAKELSHWGLTDSNEEVIEALIQVGNENADKISAAIQHLALYLDDSKVRQSDVQTLFPEKYNPNEYSFIEAIASKEPQVARKLLSQVLNSGANPFGLLTLIHRAFCNYLKILALKESGQSKAAIQQTIGMPAWLFNKQMAAAEHHTLKSVKSALAQILRADSKLKNRSVGTEAIFDELISSIST